MAIFGTPNRRADRKGTVSVEAALVMPLLIILLFGIIEFGFIFKDILLLHQIAREGARVAAIGAVTTDIVSRVEGSAATLNTDVLSIQLEYRTHSGEWSSWAQLGDYEGQNDAPTNAQIRVSLTYTHPLVCGPFFGRFIGEPGATSIALHSSMVMNRE